MTRKTWRCFHCDELFTSARTARIHFGLNEGATPGCVIAAGGQSSLLEALRTTEAEVEHWMMAVHNENTESARAYYAQQSRHREQLTAVEVSSYEKGLRDLRPLIERCAGALNFILAFYEPGQTYLDTNAWKECEGSARALFAELKKEGYWT